MKLLDLDFSEYKNDIITSLIEVYGYEYADIIRERFDNIVINTYNNKLGTLAYSEFLLKCKSKELCLKFLELIGYDLTEYNIKSYSDDFTGELLELVNNYLGGINAFTYSNVKETFRAFNEANEEDIDSQIKFINFIKNTNITRDNYDEFKTTPLYKEVLSISFEYNEIFNRLSDEMYSYEEDIQEYEDYFLNEDDRYDNILKNKSIELYNEISLYFTQGIKDALVNLNDISATKKIFSFTIDRKLYIEYFSKEDEIKLNDKKTSLFERQFIIESRKKYFKKMGIKFDEYKDDYYELIKREDVKKIIPNEELVNKVVEVRKQKLDIANKEFIFESDDFKKLFKKFNETDSARKFLYKIIKNNLVFVTSGSDSYGNFKPLFFLTIKDWQCGAMDYVVLHELIHAVEAVSNYDCKKGDYRCGFEQSVLNSLDSPYDHAYRKRRKYEMFNETITDILAIEARDKLHEKGIYFMEQKELCKTNVNNYNSKIVLKNMVRPFLEKYRSLINNARICGDVDRLTKYIGRENFDELNDIVDYVDSLLYNGLLDKINDKENPLAVSYYNALEKLETVYSKMDEYYIDYVGSIVSINRLGTKM